MSRHYPPVQEGDPGALHYETLGCTGRRKRDFDPDVYVKKTPNASEVLCTEDLSKRYGRITAVESLNIRLLRGEVFGFLGPNGSGKSTTVGMMLGLIRPTNGRVLAFGSDMTLHPWPASSGTSAAG